MTAGSPDTATVSSSSVDVVSGSGAARPARIRARLAASTCGGNPGLLRAQLALGIAWTADWAFTIVLGVVAFRDGGAAAVGVVGFLRMAPSALLVPVGAAFADRFRRDRVLLWSCFVRAAATAALAVVLAAGGPTQAVYALAVVATAALSVFRPAHQALLPGFCKTPLEDAAIEVLTRVDMLRPLPMPAIDALAVSVDEVTVAPGHAVFHQDDAGDGFHVIEHGEVDVIRDGRLLCTMGPGDGFGEIALLQDRLRTATVRARTPLRLLSLNRRNFVAAVDGYESSAREATRLVKARLDGIESRVGCPDVAGAVPTVGRCLT